MLCVPIAKEIDLLACTNRAGHMYSQLDWVGFVRDGWVYVLSFVLPFYLSFETPT